MLFTETPLMTNESDMIVDLAHFSIVRLLVISKTKPQTDRW